MHQKTKPVACAGLGTIGTLCLICHLVPFMMPSLFFKALTWIRKIPRLLRHSCCSYTPTPTHTHTYTHTHTHTHTHRHTQTRTHTHKLACTHKRTFTNVCVLRCDMHTCICVVCVFERGRESVCFVVVCNINSSINKGSEVRVDDNLWCALLPHHRLSSR